MVLKDIVTGALILLGVGIMFLSLLGTRRILRLLKRSRYTRGWLILSILIVFFLIGYLVTFLFIFSQEPVLELPCIVQMKIIQVSSRGAGCS